MYKLCLVSALFALALTACERQKQASAEVGAIPKTIIDKATNDINAAQALTDEKQKTLENLDATTEVGK